MLEEAGSEKREQLLPGNHVSIQQIVSIKSFYYHCVKVMVIIISAFFPEQ